TTVIKAEQHLKVTGARKVQLSAGDHLQVAGSSHTRITQALVVEAAQEVHISAGEHVVVGAGLILSLSAGGQHLVLNPAGIFSSVPILLGGVPLPGTPAMPLAPGDTQSLIGNVLLATQGQIDKIMEGELTSPLCAQVKPVGD
ncbi:type VI secretion system tip protein VgrG, partial [Pseudomonas sp. CCI3.2]|nr:type VI secretion system tip protein VgrG [Pseudomonas sp. MH10out]MEB0104660.1 type VI secretion system tip protein VgrG [Pseudomonas sp. CCI3.2]MEB0133619.1 type VI secretion system tip protein VgrG [Pseudomonas sp. CCI2.4]MEB0160884.1 type VI secretion system tip protein VgrG [Pseudomonas sp. AH2 (2023)]MEB0170417.1 type VI secretion system tip protein VgrG [Pseudomonas sp. CCC4.4]